MRSVVVLASLLVVTLIGSYVSWTGEDEVKAPEDRVAMYRADADDLRKLAWKSEDLTVEVEKKQDAGGNYLWVTITETEKPKKKDADKDKPEDAAATEDAPADGTDTPTPADAPATPEPEPEPTVKVSSFKGNDAADKMWTSFAPLMAMRELVTDGNTDTKVFGLDAPTATIEVTRANGALTLTVGGETWGGRDRYVQADGKTWLVDDADLRPLQYAKTRLVERTLQPVAEADADRVSVTRGGATVTYVRTNKDDKDKAFWAREDQAQTRDTVGATWLAKVFKLRVQAYVADADKPAQLEPVFTFAVHGDGKAWTIDVLREGGTDKPDFYAQSSWNRGLVKLTRSLAEEVVADLDAIMDTSRTPEDKGAAEAVDEPKIEGEAGAAEPGPGAPRRATPPTPPIRRPAPPGP